MMETRCEPEQPSDMSVMDHLRELRKRLIISLLMISVGTVSAYFFAPELFVFLCSPYYSAFPLNSLIGTGPAEAVTLRIHVSIFAGVVLVSPLLFHQLWLFLSPGMEEKEKRHFVPFVLVTTILFLAGMFFCYRVMLPLSMGFFHEQYSELGMIPQVRMTEHLSLIIHLLIGFGVIFEMPVLAYFLGRMGVINHRMMLSWGRYAVVAIFIVAAVLTPPDVVDQLAMAFPLLALYGVSIMIVKAVALNTSSQ